MCVDNVVGAGGVRIVVWLRVYECVFPDECVLADMPSMLDCGGLFVYVVFCSAVHDLQRQTECPRAVVVRERGGGVCCVRVCWTRARG